MAIDKLINSTQGDSIIAALGSSGSIAQSLAIIAAKSNTPYNSDNKLNPSFIAYDTTHAAVTEAQRTQIETNTTNNEINKNNILSVANQSTQYNLLFYNLSTLKSYNSNNAIWNENVCTIGNISFTINDDMSITVSGSSGNSSTYFKLADGVSFPAIRFQGCPAGGGPHTYQLQAYYSSAPASSLNDNGSGASAEANSWSEIYITIRPNQTISDPITFFPMVIPQSLYDSGFNNYQPYALSNAELTNNILLLGEKYIDKSVANTAKTISLASASQYIITINAYAEYGVFLCYKYNNESSTRLYTLSKSSNFDQNVTVAAEANSNNISITPASSSVWYVVGGVRLN